MKSNLKVRCCIQCGCCVILLAFLVAGAPSTWAQYHYPALPTGDTLFSASSSHPSPAVLSSGGAVASEGDNLSAGDSRLGLRDPSSSSAWTGISEAAASVNETSGPTVLTAYLRPSVTRESGKTEVVKHIPLAPPSQRFKGEGFKGEEATRSHGTLQMLLSVGSSLFVVVGLFLGVAWCYRKTLHSSIGGGLPKQVVNVLGRTSISARQQMVLVRFGSKLVLVSVIQGEARTLSEIADPLEVDQLVGLCESNRTNSISSSFRSILLQEGKQ